MNVCDSLTQIFHYYNTLPTQMRGECLEHGDARA